MQNKYSSYTYIFLLILGIIYFLSIGKDPALGDTLGFTIQGYYGFAFESNATNHFLFSNVLGLAHKILPFMNVHILFVSICIISGLLALFYLRKLLLLLEVSEKSSLMCIMLFGFSFTFWRQAVITEVYTFYLLFVILFLINVFKFLKEKEIKYFYYLSIFLGILFLIHIQTILFGPFYCFLLFKNFKLLKKHIIYGGLITLLLFSILLLPVALGRHSLVAIFTDNAYENSLFDYDPSTLFKSIMKNLGILGYNFLFFSVFIFLGVKNKKYLNYILFGALPFLFFCIKHNVSDVHVFQLVPYIFIIILIGQGLDRFPKIPLILPVILPIFYFASFKIVQKTSIGKNFEKEKGFKGGTRYMLFPPLNQNPDLNSLLKNYEKDSLYEKYGVKEMYPLIIQWEEIKKKNNY
ncbi:protein O-mannosyl-transferase family [Chryseobacterium sp. SIMBA_038]|uniref:protein O-mannosyl-transferase family n=1 Tax=Chryseobacterium sp. SIMBA_038 TaxID=3085780 RepID=UPI00397DB17A